METQHDMSPSKEFASSNPVDSSGVKDQSTSEAETPLPIINVGEGNESNDNEVIEDGKKGRYMLFGTTSREEISMVRIRRVAIIATSI